MEGESHDVEKIWWDARVAAIESVLGESEELQGHAIIPFFMGADIGGAADILYFRNHLLGVISVTCELIGGDESGAGVQVQNEIGEYELMVCERENPEWGGSVISRLAYYTLKAQLNPGETMSIGSTVPQGSTIAGFLFVDYARFVVMGRNAGLLLCLGITEDELQLCRDGNRTQVEAALKVGRVYPYTDLYRNSVLDRHSCG